MSPAQSNEQAIQEAIDKLSRQLSYHCQDCRSAVHTEFLEEVINDLNAQRPHPHHLP